MPRCCEKGKHPMGTYKRRHDAVPNPLLGTNATGYRVLRKVSLSLMERLRRGLGSSLGSGFFGPQEPWGPRDGCGDT